MRSANEWERGSIAETNPGEVLEHARQDDDVGAARAVCTHLDEIVMGDVEVERRESLGAERSGEDGIETARQGKLVEMHSKTESQVTHLR